MGKYIFNVFMVIYLMFLLLFLFLNFLFLKFSGMLVLIDCAVSYYYINILKMALFKRKTLLTTSLLFNSTNISNAIVML